MPKQIKKWGTLFLPYMIIFIMAVIIMFPQIKSDAFIPGVDSFFHMNRFYDTAMQIKTGHYSYFASIFGFNQTGRVVNALYGPLFAYFSGLVLLICKTWFRFQVVDSLLVLVIGGGLMYHLCRINRVKTWLALPIGCIYMISTPILIWVLDQQFTGWGAALLPLVIMAGTRMVDELNIKIIPLAVAMSIVLQTHLMSSLIGAVALVPLFVVSLVLTGQRIKMIFKMGLAVLLTLLLTGNVWGGMLEVFHNNNLVPVFPQTNMIVNAVGIDPNHTIERLGLVFSIVFVVVVAYLILFWRKSSYQLKTFSISGILLLWISSKLFPWNWLAEKIPSITYTIQMPKRFVVVAVILLLLSLGMILSDSPLRFSNSWVDLGIKFGALIILFVSGLISTNAHFNKRISNYYSQQVVSQPVWLLHYHSDDSGQIRNAYHSSNLAEGLNIITKATPDYLPTREPITADNYNDLHPYHLANNQLVSPSLKVKKWVNNNNDLMVKWTNHHFKPVKNSIPVVKYANTELILNGKVVKNYHLSKIGKVRLKSKPGVNRLEVRYNPSNLYIWIMWITIITWLVLIIWLFV